MTCLSARPTPTVMAATSHLEPILMFRLFGALATIVVGVCVVTYCAHVFDHLLSVLP